MNTQKLIVGLGNPGRIYRYNRHNVGFQVIDHLAKAHGLRFNQRRANARLAMGHIAGVPVILAKPQTFMNLSGRPVAGLIRFYGVALSNMLVVYDDLDLPVGRIRLRPGGGTGGHKGMKSLIEHLGSEEFPRLRIGIGRPPGHMDPADYVLQDFSTTEGEVLRPTLERAIAAIARWLTAGLDAAMNEFNA